MPVCLSHNTASISRRTFSDVRAPTRACIMQAKSFSAALGKRNKNGKSILIIDLKYNTFGRFLEYFALCKEEKCKKNNARQRDVPEIIGGASNRTAKADEGGRTGNDDEEQVARLYRGRVIRGRRTGRSTAAHKPLDNTMAVTRRRRAAPLSSRGSPPCLSFSRRTRCRRSRRPRLSRSLSPPCAWSVARATACRILWR